MKNRRTRRRFFCLFKKNSMKKLLACLLLIPALAFIQATNPVSVKDFKPAFGEWKGSLTYMDYSSGKPYTMPANIIINKDKSNDHRLILDFQYPDEPKANEKDTLIISNDGLRIDDAMVISKEKSVGGVLQIITEEPGVDGNDNRKAVLRHIYSISKRTFFSRKEVKFDGQEKFMIRNEYKMSR